MSNVSIGHGHQLDVMSQPCPLGGGTANLYRSDQYRELLEMARSVPGAPGPGVQVTLEGVPQLFSKDKLAAMQDAGINRISIGVQQLEPEMIRMSGRKQTKEQVLRAIEWCHQLALQCSVDLIYGWPLQTVDRMLSDLDTITTAGVAHITHYELNLAGRTDFALKRAHQLPSTEENLQLYRAAKAFLEDRGYTQITAHDWKKPRTEESGVHSFEESWHVPLSLRGDTLHSLDLWGWGYGGVSFFLGTPELPGWTYRNNTRVASYFEALDAGRYPIERGFRFTTKDQRLNVLFQALQGMRVDRHGYRAVFGLDVVDEHAAVWQALAELGWVEIGDDSVTLIGDGVFYTPLIQTTLARAAAGSLAPQATTE
jgi:oxygen-independent coproporphyrinogen-3 oxidase